jgi:hypothetical protein
MAERTVKAHRSHIALKLGVESVVEMVHLANQIGLLASLESWFDPPLACTLHQSAIVGERGAEYTFRDVIENVRQEFTPR